jgi:hypothetical protein
MMILDLIPVPRLMELWWYENENLNDCWSTKGYVIVTGNNGVFLQPPVLASLTK